METDETTMSCGKRCKYFGMFHWKGIIIFFTPIICLPLFFLEPEKEYRCCYVLCVMAVYWIAEVVPLGVTSLIPILAFPLLDIMTSKAVCLSYFKDALFLFFGSLVIALAIEFSNLHKRIALNVILLVGCSPRRLHFSLMIVTMFISMWITNAATTAMMCPIIKAVMEELAAQGMAEITNPDKVVQPNEPPYPSKTATCFYLSVAYASSIGGLGTLIGTGTNLVFMGIYQTRFPKADDINFLNFMAFNSLPMVVHTILSYFWMEWMYMGLCQPKSKEYAMANVGKEGIEVATKVIVDKIKELGSLTCHEVQTGFLFLLMVTLFITRKPGVFPGYADFLNAKDIKTSCPMTLIVVLLFLLPVNYMFMKYCVCSRPSPTGTVQSLMSWRFLNGQYPWNLSLLLGGGFALSEGIKLSGFAVMAGQSLSALKVFPAALLQLMVITISTIGTAFTANMAMCNILTPVLLELALAIEVHPAYLGMPSCLALSMAFHFPVSTPPNAIVSGFASVRTIDMAIGGIGPSIITIFGFFFFFNTWAWVIYPGFFTLPDWTVEENP